MSTFKCKTGRCLANLTADTTEFHALVFQVGNRNTAFCGFSFHRPFERYLSPGATDPGAETGKLTAGTGKLQ